MAEHCTILALAQKDGHSSRRPLDNDLSVYTAGFLSEIRSS